MTFIQSNECDNEAKGNDVFVGSIPATLKRRGGEGGDGIGIMKPCQQNRNDCNMEQLQERR